MIKQHIQKIASALLSPQAVSIYVSILVAGAAIEVLELTQPPELTRPPEPTQATESTQPPEPTHLSDLCGTRSPETAPNDTDVWEIFFSAFGLIYAIVVGLFIIEAHRRMRDLATAMQSELSAIADVDDFLKYFDGDHQNDEASRAVRRALWEYADNEFIRDLRLPLRDPIPDGRADSRSPTKSERDARAKSEKRREEIGKVISAVKALKPGKESDNERFALDAIINKIGELTTFIDVYVNNATLSRWGVLCHATEGIRRGVGCAASPRAGALGRRALVERGGTSGWLPGQFRDALARPA